MGTRTFTPETDQQHDADRSKVPLLQLALDEPDLSAAMRIARAAAPAVDVFEAGTVLLASHGLGAVETLRTAFPGHRIVADMRVVRAGEVLARMAFEAGADWLTVMAAAPLQTIQAAVDQARAHDGHIQAEMDEVHPDDQPIELAGMGVTHAIIHRTHEAGQAPADSGAEPDMVGRLHDAGLLVSVAGGVVPERVGELAGLPVHVVIAGRAIRGASDPADAARRMRARLDEVFGS